MILDVENFIVWFKLHWFILGQILSKFWRYHSMNKLCFWVFVFFFWRQIFIWN